MARLKNVAGVMMRCQLNITSSNVTIGFHAALGDVVFKFNPRNLEATPKRVLALDTKRCHQSQSQAPKVFLHFVFPAIFGSDN